MGVKELRARPVRSSSPFGGPIVIPKFYYGHDKTFFFFNFEQFRETQIVTTGLTTVPTDILCLCHA